MTRQYNQTLASRQGPAMGRRDSGLIRTLLVVLCTGHLVLGAMVATASVAFPLKSSSNQRYLVTQDDVPFLVLADSPWSLFVALDEAELEAYLDERKSQGFNALVSNLIEHEHMGIDNPYQWPTNRFGDGPFLDRTDFTKPNEAYFAHADRVIQEAAERDMVIFLNPCYLGYPNTPEGWYEEVLEAGEEPLREYGRFVGERYADATNIIWTLCGDRNPGDARPMVEALAEGMTEYVSNILFTAHCIRDFSSRSQFGDSDWLTLDAVYVRPSTLLEESIAAYERTPVMPALLFEAYYEGHPYGTGVTPLPDVRAQGYQSLLTGMCGFGYGNNPVWLFTTGWQEAVGSPGALEMSYMNDLFLSRPWSTFVPDLDHEIVTEGYGSGQSYIASAGNGQTAFIYFPAGGRTATVDPRSVAPRTAKLWWFSPLNGEVQDAGVRPSQRLLEISTPDDNDWVLVVEDYYAGFAPPGTQAPPVVVEAVDPVTLGSGRPLNLQLDASGGFGNYTWALAAGSDPLPEGVTLSESGLLSGTPASDGEHEIIVRAFDGSNPLGTQTIQLSVQPVESRLEILSTPEEAVAQNGLNLQFTSNVPGTYAVESSADLDDWSQLESFLFEGGFYEIFATNIVPTAPRFYRTVID